MRGKRLVDLEEIRREFSAKQGVYEQLKDEALFILKRALSNTQVKLHSITDRVKEVDSFIDKVRRKESKKPFEEVRDIVGVRVICLFPSDIERIGDVIRASFQVLEEDNRIERGEVSSFGYMSLHFIAMMKPEHSGPRYDPIARLPFEIQVRTIAMDAWANVSHHLDYKSAADVPSDLRRDFYALSGLFYVADRHFEMFFRASQRSREKMARDFGKVELPIQQEINLDSLTAYLLNKFPDREESDPQFVSDLVAELSAAGIKTIVEIDNAVEAGWEAFEKYEKEASDVAQYGGRFARVGVIRALLDIMSEEFRRIRGLYEDPERLNKKLKYARLLKPANKE